MSFSPDEPKQALARILGPSGEPVGTGCLTLNGLVVTCAHVIRDVLGLEKATGLAPPQGRIALDFPFQREKRGRSERKRYEAEVAPGGWGWVNDTLPEDDIAILQLLGEPPFLVGRLFRHLTGSMRMCRSSCRAFQQMTA